MKIVKLYPLFLISLIGCETPRDYFNRPQIKMCIANGDGTAFCNGEEYNSTNMICAFPDEYERLERYYSDKEYRLFKCLKYNRCK